MSTTPNRSPSRGGRRCVACTHPDRAEIEAALTAGSSSIRGVAGRYGLAPESVRRHVRTHLTTAAQAALVSVDGTPGLTIAARLLDVADHARDTRAAAELRNEFKLALAAGQAEARVLGILAPLDTLAEAIAEELTDAGDALQILATAAVASPETAPAIIAVMIQRGRPEWAERVRVLAANSRNEIAQ